MKWSVEPEPYFAISPGFPISIPPSDLERGWPPLSSLLEVLLSLSEVSLSLLELLSRVRSDAMTAMAMMRRRRATVMIQNHRFPLLLLGYGLHFCFFIGMAWLFSVTGGGIGGAGEESGGGCCG
jgi:hypothetical protein